MKTPLLLLLTFYFSHAAAQITTPVNKANFGVDGELRANNVGNFVQSGDDWFYNGTPGMGQPVIDTNGSAAMIARYLTDPAFRKLPFFRTMRVPQLSVINNRLWLDAVYIRDYNGQSGGDSTAFVLSNKNGDSPQNWKAGITSVLDKNDISDMMIHVRRAGPSKTDSLWFFGGLSLQGTTGNRYFDFELYQTDIFYSRATGAFSNYGPDAGHTSWQFDGEGKIVKPGDVIFSAEYSSSSLTMIEARVWVHKNDVGRYTPAFDWGGDFVGASNGALYGYANIRPKSAGAYYTGLQSGNNTWAGAFGFVDGNNNFQTTYTARQFMEFSVNLSKLGLDPITLLGGSACGLPFRRILVKTRTSTSFSSELKDFIGPFDFFVTPPVKAQPDVPFFCGPVGVSTIKVTNPLPASVYTWSTADGHIVYDSVGPSITVDKPGTYIVTQQLLDGCGSFARDTVVIWHDAGCVPMETRLLNFSAQAEEDAVQVAWAVASNKGLQHFIVQKSYDGKTFWDAQTFAVNNDTAVTQYAMQDAYTHTQEPFIYYRLLLKGSSGFSKYSRLVRVENKRTEKPVMLYPNPAATQLYISVPPASGRAAQVRITNSAGVVVLYKTMPLSKGTTTLAIPEVALWKPGFYFVEISIENKRQWFKFIKTNNSYLSPGH